MRELKKREEKSNWTGEPIASISFTSAADSKRWAEYSSGETPKPFLLTLKAILGVLGLGILASGTASVIFSLARSSVEDAIKDGGQVLAIGLGFLPFVYYLYSSYRVTTADPIHATNVDLHTIVVRMTRGHNDTTIDENVSSGELDPLGSSAQEGESYPPTYARFTDALIINSAIFPLESIQSVELTEPGEEGSKEIQLRVEIDPPITSLLLPLPSSCVGGEADTIIAPFLCSREEGEP